MIASGVGCSLLMAVLGNSCGQRFTDRRAGEPVPVQAADIDMLGAIGQDGAEGREVRWPPCRHVRADTPDRGTGKRETLGNGSGDAAEHSTDLEEVLLSWRGAVRAGTGLRVLCEHVGACRAGV